MVIMVFYSSRAVTIGVTWLCLILSQVPGFMESHHSASEHLLHILKIPFSASDQRLGSTDISVDVAAYAALLVVFVGAFA